MMPPRSLVLDLYFWVLSFTVGTAGAFLGMLLAAFAYEVMK